MRQFYLIFVPFFLVRGHLPADTQLQSGVVQQTCEVWGQVITPGDPLDDGLNIELNGKSGPRQRVPLRHGNFDFHSVPAGSYQFRVVDSSGRELFKRTKVLTGTNDHVILIAPFDKLDARSISYRVSLRQLANQTRRPARDAFNASEKALEAGEIEKSIKQLEKAVAIDPLFPEAQVNLAAQYLEAGRVQEAMRHLESAFNASPEFREAAYDFTMLLIITEDYPRAEAVARRALAYQGSPPGMQGLLAVSMIAQHRSLGEAYEYLRRAAGFPVVRLLAANALAAVGRFAAAAVQVREYLSRSAHPCERKDLEGWLERLDVPLAGEAQSEPE